MARSFTTLRLSLGAADLMTGTADPNTLVYAPVPPQGSYYLQSTGALWYNSDGTNTGWLSAGGGSAASAGDIEVVASSQVSAVYANTVSFVPLVKSLDDTIEFQFRAAATGDVAINVLYAMSAANGGNVQLQVSSGVFAVGTDPAAALTAGAAFVFTPGNDANLHLISNATSAELTLAVTAGALVRVVLTRVDGAPDTHTGDMRVIQITWVAL